MPEGQFDRLFEPLRIRDIEIPNRIAASGLGWTWAGMDDEETLPTQALAQFWAARAAGGLGLIISEPQSVHPTSTPTPRVIENSSDAVIEPYRAVTEAVHVHGTKIIAQLNHNGHLGGTGFHSLPLWAPSAVRAPAGSRFAAGGGVLPREMDQAEIDEIVEAFAAAAGRDIEAGFDGIELNAAEGFLMAEFLSPLTNHRDDAYGGSVEARRLFLLQVVSAVRERIGPEPLLGVRIGPDSYLEQGLTVDDMGPLAVALGATTEVDYLSTTPLHLPHMGHQPGAFSEIASAARVGGLPVLYFGWVDGPETAESLLETGVCDLVGMSRATLADLELPKKARVGETDTIRPCIACNQTCLTLGSLCLLNPQLAGIEPGMNGPQQPKDARQVLVIGGGPAGIEAACLLASRGHGVTLWERDDELGGQLRVAARAPHRERIAALADYYERELERSGVTVELGRSATADDIQSFGPDAVVVATGAFGHVPETPGVDQPHVTDVRSILRGFVEPGEHTVVVLGRAEHRFQGLTVAEFIAAKGKSVHIVTDAFFAGDLWDEPTRLDTVRRLKEFGAEFSTMSELVQISEHDVEIRNRYSLEPRTLEADTVVLAYGDDADSNLLAELEGGALPVYSIGDVVAPRDLQGAVLDANLLAAVF